MVAASTATIAAAVLAGCGQPFADEVREVAGTFYQAHEADDGAAACHRLAPETRSQLEEAAGAPCAEALLQEEVPAVTEPTRVQVFGTQAQVVWSGETTFLARFEDGWKVMAAACRPRRERPFDCAISGG